MKKSAGMGFGLRMEIPVSRKHEGEGQVRGGGRIQMWASLQDKEVLSSVYARNNKNKNKNKTKQQQQKEGKGTYLKEQMRRSWTSTVME